MTLVKTPILPSDNVAVINVKEGAACLLWCSYDFWFPAGFPVFTSLLNLWIPSLLSGGGESAVGHAFLVKPHLLPKWGRCPPRLGPLRRRSWLWPWSPSYLSCPQEPRRSPKTWSPSASWGERVSSRPRSSCVVLPWWSRVAEEGVKVQRGSHETWDLSGERWLCYSLVFLLWDGRMRQLHQVAGKRTSNAGDVN